MNKTQIALSTIAACFLAGCGGGGGVAGDTEVMTDGPTPPVLPADDPTAPTASQDYADLDDTSGTSALSGIILVANSSVDGTTGTITHGDDTFTATGINGAISLDDTSAFDLPSYAYSTDVELSSGSIAIVGVSTAEADMRPSGTAAFSGDFRAQLVDASQATATVLNWDADIQVNFSGDGDVDLTLTGGGSDLIDTIRISNANIDGTTFSGGTLTTSNNGTRNNITGTDVDLNGAFFGYNTSLQLPAEAGGALVTTDADTDISGVFITSANP